MSMRYYEPSADEVRMLEGITKQIEEIAIKDFQISNPKVEFSYDDGLEYSRAAEGKELATYISGSGKAFRVRVMAQDGQVIYYKYDKKKTYVSSPTSTDKGKKKKIERGEWNPGIQLIKEDMRDDGVCADLEKNFPFGVRENPAKYLLPKREFPFDNDEDDDEDRCPPKAKKTPVPLYDRDREYEDWLAYVAYCEEYREMYGTDPDDFTGFI